MSLSICAECLSRLRIPNHTPVTTTLAAAAAATTFVQRSSFHSSSAQYASPLMKKKGPVLAKPSRQSQSAKLKKGSRERPKLPPVGERRAQRRRIVLSNTNALEVPDLQYWSTENMADPETAGKIMALDGPLLDQLRDSKAFKTTQNWSMFRRPATLVRSETIQVGQDMESVNEHAKTLRHLVTGEKASGKSIFALQTMCMAYMNKWIVLNVPEAQDFINNTSSYAPLRQAEDKQPEEAEQLYIQPHLTQALLARAAYSNASVLEGLRLNHPVPKHLPFKQGPHATLKDLVQLGVDDHSFAWPVWQALWRELNEPGKNPRPPVLLAADGVDHWMGPSKYRNAEHRLIHAQQFTLVRQFTNLLFGSAEPFVNGGMVLFSTTGSNTPAYPTWDLLVDQLRARARGTPPTDPAFPLPRPYSKPDERVLDLTPAPDGLDLLELKGLSVPESKGYLEYFVRSGLLRVTVTPGTVAEFRSLSNGGVVGELAKLGARVTA